MVSVEVVHEGDEVIPAIYAVIGVSGKGIV